MYDTRNGNYALLMPAGTRDTMISVALSSDNIGGIIRRVPWSEEGFDLIGEDLIWCAANDIRYLPMITDKTFQNGSLPGANPMPPELHKLAVPNRGGGMTSLRWLDEVTAAFSEFIQGIYITYNRHMAFEGVMLQESAPSIPDEYLDLHNYTPEAYADFYKEVLRAPLEVAPEGIHLRKKIYYQGNFAPKQALTLVNDFLVSEEMDQVEMGGPDCLPGHDPLEPMYEHMRSYPYSRFIGMSPMTYRNGRPLEEAHAFATSDLGATMLFWTYLPSAWPRVLRIIG